MRVGITGSPGTGKSTISENLDRQIINIKEFAQKKGLGQKEDLYEVDIEAVNNHLPENCWVEGHLAHKLDLDYCIVLRTKPDVLERRLNQRDYSDQKVQENVEAEAMDLILSEAVQKDFPVYEIDTTDKEVEQTVSEIKKAINDQKEKVGVVDWKSFL